MKLQLCVDHADGSIVLNSSDPQDLRAAAVCLDLVALSESGDEDVFVPTETGPVVLRAGDIDRVDLLWEA